MRTERLALRGFLGLALAAASVATIGGPASADTSTGNTIAHVGVVAGITLTGLTSSFTLTGAPGATVPGVGAVVFNVETNNVAGYAVTVQSETATMVPTAVGNSDSIPIAVLTVKETGATTYTPMTALSGTAVTVHTQGGRSANGGDVLSNDFQLRIPVANVDTYSATLDYIAATL